MFVHAEEQQRRSDLQNKKSNEINAACEACSASTLPELWLILWASHHFCRINRVHCFDTMKKSFHWCSSCFVSSYDQQRWFCWISRDGSFMIRAFPSGIITGIINWCHSEHGQLWTRSLTTNQSSLQMCFSNASRIAGANGWMKFKDSQWGRRERRES